MSEVREVLIRVRERLSDPSHWCQGSMALDEHDNPIDPQSKEACRWCLLGAIHAETSDNVMINDINNILVRKYTEKFKRHYFIITAANDVPTTTHQDILTLLDEEIKR